MQSGLWKQWSSSRVGSRTLAGIALAVVFVSVTGARLQAESIPTDTQLRVQTAQIGNRTVPSVTVHVEPARVGVVTLLDGSVPVGSAAVDASGDATIALPSLAAGAHGLHASFAGAVDGTTEFASSVSPETTVVADATGVANFTVTAKSTSLSVVQGSTFTTTLTLTPVNGYTGYITLSCSQLVADSACSFVPANVYVGSAAASPSTMSIETYGPTTSLATHSNMAYALLFPGILALAGFGLRERKAFRGAGMALLAIAFIGGMSGCAQRYHYLNKPPQASPGTAIGAKAFTLEAQSISGTTVITNTLSMTLTVTAP